MSGCCDHSNVQKQVQNDNMKKGGKYKHVNIAESGSGGARRLRSFLLREQSEAI
jgi:hypothetical protein